MVNFIAREYKRLEIYQNSNITTGNCQYFDWMLITLIILEKIFSACKAQTVVLESITQEMQGRRLLSSEADRNTAPPAESAVWKRGRREHSGAGQLNIAVGWHVVRVKYKKWSCPAVGRPFSNTSKLLSGFRQQVVQCGWYRGCCYARSPRDTGYVFRGFCIWQAWVLSLGQRQIKSRSK